MIRRVARRLRSLLVDRVLGLGPVREGVAILRRDQDALQYRVSALARALDEARMLTARGLIAAAAVDRPLSDAEFRVFSQWGEDGIIQYLLRRVKIADRSFVEFGVENYQEANTRFLLLNDNWRGLVLDGSADYIASIKADSISWRHDLTAVQAFVDAENINTLIGGNGFSGEIGLLSIDIDGNDYWVWKAITVVQPTIVVVEFNSVFGSRRAVTVPYQRDFFRTRAHHSNLYFGASLPALVELGRQKGYAFVGCTSAGNDAFFVRRDRLGGAREVSVEEGYVASRFRESRDAQGRLTYLSGPARLDAIRDMPLVDVTTGERLTAADLRA